MFERFSDRARKVLMIANQEAQLRGHKCIGTEHVLLGIVKEGTGVACAILKDYNVDYCVTKIEIEKLIKNVTQNRPFMGKLPQTPRVKNILLYAQDESKKFGHGYVGTEHLLLGSLVEEEGIASLILKKFGLTAEKLRKDIIHLLGEPKPEEREKRGAAHVHNYWYDLTRGEIADKRGAKDAARENWHKFYSMEFNALTEPIDEKQKEIDRLRIELRRILERDFEISIESAKFLAGRVWDEKDGEALRELARLQIDEIVNGN